MYINNIAKKKDLFHKPFFFKEESVMYIPSYSWLCTCVYLFLVSPVAVFGAGFSLVECCSGSFWPFLQSDY